MGKSAAPPSTLLPTLQQVITPRKRLESGMLLLEARVGVLERQIREGDEAAWEPYLATLTALAALLPHVTEGGRGELITTETMARRLGIKPKTLLKHKAAGRVKPALQRGKLIRWKGTEAISGG